MSIPSNSKTNQFAYVSQFFLRAEMYVKLMPMLKIDQNIPLLMEIK